MNNFTAVLAYRYDVQVPRLYVRRKIKCNSLYINLQYYLIIVTKIVLKCKFISIILHKLLKKP